MKKFVFIFLILGVVFYLKPEWLKLGGKKGAYDEQGNPKVVVFVHDKCGRPCDDAETILKSHHVNYELYSLDENETNMALWKEYGAVNSFPNVIVGDERVYGSYKGYIVAALAVNFGDRVLSSAEKAYMNNHFYDDGTPRVVLYGATWCVFCKELRRVLDENNVEYLNIDVDKSEYEKDITETMDIPGYPVVYYGFKRLIKPNAKDVMALL